MTSTSQTAPALEGEGGRYTALVHQDWEIWGPCGGYVAAIALRAAGAESPFARPASFFCHYLSVAAFEPVDLVVTPLRSGRTVLAQRVEMTQGGRAVLEAMVWSVGEVAGLEHQDVLPPDVADPLAVPARTEGPPPETRTASRTTASGTTSSSGSSSGPRPGRRPDRCHRRGGPGCVTARRAPSTTPGPTPPAWWSCSTSAAGRPAIAPTRTASHGFIAPSLDLYASFQDPTGSSGWLLLDAHSPVARDGLLSWTGRIWSERRSLMASGGGQAVFRHT